MKWYVGAFLLLLIAWLLGLSLLSYAMYALVGLMLVGRWLARIWANNVTAERTCNQLTAEIGDSVTVLIKVTNRGWLTIAWLLLEDLLPRHALIHSPPTLELSGRRVELMTLKGCATKTLLYQLKCNRRGYFQIGPLMLETGDLFGLHRRFRVLSEPNFLLVYPQVIPLEGYDVASRRPIGEVRMSYRLYEDPTRIAGVRQYQPGDPLNRVHWRATARTGELHSKIYEPSTVVGATLLLDFHKGSHDPKHEPHRSELAITATASLANAVYEMGQQIGLLSNGRDAVDRIRQEGWQRDPRTRRAARQTASMLDASERLEPVIVPTQRGAEQLLRILESLARLELTDGLDLAQLIDETTSRMPRDASIIAILQRVTPRNAVALGNLVRRGFAVTAILNIHDAYDFGVASGLLAVERIAATQLMNEAAISTICRSRVLR